jgi:alpha-tubulin suppressor-like RCC1 family protein
VTSNLFTSSLVSLAAGSFHTCVVNDAASGGQVVCWGNNGSGQLGNGATTDALLPVKVSGVNGAGQAVVTAGTSHTCALSQAGAVHCWGANGSGQLGDGTNTNSDVPVQVKGLINNVVKALFSGGNHNCAILFNGTVQCWGDNSLGQLGIGALPASSNVPVAVSGFANATTLGTGQNTTCGLIGSTVKCTGDNTEGQIGDGFTTKRTTPVTVQSALPPMSSVTLLGVSPSATHTCAIANAPGNVFCWGNDADSELGIGEKPAVGQLKTAPQEMMMP